VRVRKVRRDGIIPLFNLALYGCVAS